MESVDSSMSKQESSCQYAAPSPASSQSRPSSESSMEQQAVRSVAESSRRCEPARVSSTKGKDHHAAHQGYSRSLEPKPQQQSVQDCSGRERLKRHRNEVAGRVTIPDSWGQENFLTDWMEYSTFDAPLVPKAISSAREALMAEARRSASSQRMRIESRC